MFHVKQFGIFLGFRPGNCLGRDFFFFWRNFANFLLKSLTFVLYYIHMMKYWGGGPYCGRHCFG